MAISEGNFRPVNILQILYNRDVGIGYKRTVNGQRIRGAWVLCSVLLAGCHHPSVATPGDATARSANLRSGISQNVFRAVERQVPELKCIGQRGGTASSAVVWQCQEYAMATFLLWK